MRRPEQRSHKRSFVGQPQKFENDIRRERQMDGIKKAQERGVRFGRKPRLVPEKVEQIRELRAGGTTVPDIIRQTGLSKASVYRALGA